MIAAENLIEDAARTSRTATPENVLQDAPSIEGARGERILTLSPEESRDVLQQTAVVGAVESLLQGPGSSRRRGIARETADEHRQRHGNGLGRGVFVGSDLAARLRERVAVKLGGQAVEESCLEMELHSIRAPTYERDLAVGIVARLQTHGSLANWHLTCTGSLPTGASARMARSSRGRRTTPHG